MQKSWQVNGVVGIFTRLEKGFVSVPVGLIVSLICNTRIAFRKQTCNVPYISCLLPNLNLKIVGKDSLLLYTIASDRIFLETISMPYIISIRLQKAAFADLELPNVFSVLVSFRVPFHP